MILSRFLDGYVRFLAHSMVAFLAIMVVLVFGNVFLRYAFNSGIILSEELSRWLFVWLTFFGALIGIRERAHLGTDFLIARLGEGGKKVCLIITYALMVWMCVLILQGSWIQSKINLTATSPVMDVSLTWLSGVGVVFAVSALLCLLEQLLLLFTGQLSVAELAKITESEEKEHA
ncbi:MAG: 2,3-diketo-L-gulonate transporter small permease protein YiaM [Pseudomonadota bacterium]